ncbi:hypothetical protein SADUNF_Sadunf02G0206300 [Salix dunnii]|uniref:CNNM transmembrane domain-containing protein n=1 Tax=Salix dunnii TaxID=1413687 RepID=A0A835N8U4_9ROSI|nr:hypothetical protein SADUNF_Sadunf02G0206300 [Salix dunnii]
MGLVAFGGLIAGLTPALMSLGLVDLEVLIKFGLPQDCIHAGTLSLSLVLVFGEILPQAVFTRYALTVGAAMASLFCFLLLLFFLIACPASKERLNSYGDDSVVGSTSTIPNKKAALDSHYNQASTTKNGGCSFCILEIEKAPIPELPSNEEVVGAITTEDVIKELLQGIWTRQCLALFTDPCTDLPYIDEMIVILTYIDEMIMILTVEFPLLPHAFMVPGL